MNNHLAFSVAPAANGSAFGCFYRDSAIERSAALRL
jgi:hypothetical protein